MSYTSRWWRGSYTREQDREDRELNFCEIPCVPKLKSWGLISPSLQSFNSNYSHTHTLSCWISKCKSCPSPGDTKMDKALPLPWGSYCGEKTNIQADILNVMWYLQRQGWVRGCRRCPPRGSGVKEKRSGVKDKELASACTSDLQKLLPEMYGCKCSSPRWGRSLVNYFPLEGRALFVKKGLGYFTRITLLLNLPEPQGYLSQLCGVRTQWGCWR